MKLLNNWSYRGVVLAGLLASGAISGCGGINGGPRPAPQTADFVIKAAKGNGFERFVVRISRPEVIAKARSLIANPPTNGDAPPFVFGTPAHGGAGYNRDTTTGKQWNWHLVPDSINFVDQSAEAYDGTPSDVEADTEHWVKVLKSYGPWGSIVERELPR